MAGVPLLSLLCAVGVSVRVVLVDNQPVQPIDSSLYDAPCGNVSRGTCVGGFPGVAAVVRQQRRQADASVTIGNYLQVDRMVQGHPEGLNINHRLWQRLNASCVNLFAPYFLTWKQRVEAAETIAQQQIPVISSNLDLLQGKLFRSLFHYYHIAEPLPGIRVGILFLWPKEYWASSMGFTDTVKDQIALMRTLGATCVVALVNTVFSDAERQALRLLGADVAVYQTAQPGALQRKKLGTWMLGTAQRSSTVTTLHLDFAVEVGGAHTLQHAYAVVNSSHDITEGMRDADHAGDIDFTQNLVDEMSASDRAVGVSTAAMPAGHVKAEKRDVCRHEECHLGSLATRAALASRGSDEIALINGGALRLGWDEGVIHRSDVTSAMPFQNLLCHVNLTAAEIYRALEHGVSAVTSEGEWNATAGLSGMFLQAAGLRYRFNPSLPRYKRVISIEVEDESGSGAWVPISWHRPYRVVTLKYVCEGGDGFDLTPHNGRIDKEVTQDIWSAAIHHIEDASPIEPAVHGAVVRDFMGHRMIHVVTDPENCTSTQQYSAEWEVCENCPEGEERVDGADRCTPHQESSNDSTTLITVVVCSAAAAAVAILWGLRQYEKKRRARDTMHAPRDGEVVFVFTDIQRSSDLWSAHPDAMLLALALHHKVCRRLIRRFQGYEVKTIGDAFMVAFADPVDAAKFLCVLQLELLQAEWPEEIHQHPACALQEGFSGLRVRAGAHIGYVSIRPTPRGGVDYDGHAVNVAARVSDSGSGGQIVLTEAMYRAVEGGLDCLPCGADVQYLGEYFFRGIPESVTCYQLLPEELLSREFGPLRNCTPYRDPGRSTSSLALRRNNSVHSDGKKQLIEAMQYLRRWVARFQVGIIPMHLGEVMVAALEGTGVSQQVVINSILTTLAKGGGKASPGPMRKDDQNLDTVKSAASAASGASGAPASHHAYGLGNSTRPEHDGLLRWSTVVEILKCLPQHYVIALEAYVRQTAVDQVEPLSARRTPSGNNTEHPLLPGAMS